MPAQYKHGRHDSKRSYSSSDSRERYDRDHKNSKNEKWHKKSRSRSRQNRKHEDKYKKFEYYHSRDEGGHKGRQNQPRRDDFLRRRDSHDRGSRKTVEEKKYPNKYYDHRSREKDRSYEHHRKSRGSDHSRNHRRHSSSSQSSSSSSSRPPIIHQRSTSYKGEDKGHNYQRIKPYKFNHPSSERNSFKEPRKEEEIIPKVTSKAAAPAIYQERHRKQEFKIPTQGLPPRQFIRHRSDQPQYDISKRDKVNQLHSLNTIKPLSPLKRIHSQKNIQKRQQDTHKIKVSRFQMLLNEAKTNLTFRPPPVSFLALDTYRSMNKFEVQTIDPRWSTLLKSQLQKGVDLRQRLSYNKQEVNGDPKLWCYIKDQRNEQEMELKLRIQELRARTIIISQMERKFVMQF